MGKTRNFSKRRGLAGVFLVVLAGIVLFSILALFTSEEVSTSDLFVGFLPRKIAIEQEIGLIGGPGGDGFKHSYLGKILLSQNGDAAELLREKGPIHLIRGIVTAQEHSSSFESPSGGDAKLSFSIDSTNSFGLLLVRLNGEIVYSASPKEGDRVEVSLAKSALKQAGNSLVFSTTSSGWRIWSPAYYTLRDVSISASSEGPERALSQKREFSLSKDELASFVLGRVVFTTVSATQGASISIKVNNMTIWKGPISENSLPVSVDFSSAGTGLSEKNEITFVSEKARAKIELTGAEVISFTSKSGAQGSPAMTFTLTKEDYELLRSGRMEGMIEFSVREVPSPGTLAVSIVGDREKTIISSRISAPSKVSASFGSENSVMGKNLIVFSSSEGGVFRAGELEIMLVRK